MNRQDFRPVKGPRTHSNCQLQYKCNRPGKTALDKSRGGYTTTKNVRVWDNYERCWIKV